MKNLDIDSAKVTVTDEGVDAKAAVKLWPVVDNNGTPRFAMSRKGFEAMCVVVANAATAHDGENGEEIIVLPLEVFAAILSVIQDNGGSYDAVPIDKNDQIKVDA